MKLEQYKKGNDCQERLKMKNPLKHMREENMTSMGSNMNAISTVRLPSRPGPHSLTNMHERVYNRPACYMPCRSASMLARHVNNTCNQQKNKKLSYVKNVNQVFTKANRKDTNWFILRKNIFNVKYATINLPIKFPRGDIS